MILNLVWIYVQKNIDRQKEAPVFFMKRMKKFRNQINEVNKVHDNYLKANILFGYVQKKSYICITKHRLFLS